MAINFYNLKQNQNDYLYSNSIAHVCGFIENSLTQIWQKALDWISKDIIYLAKTKERIEKGIQKILEKDFVIPECGAFALTTVEKEKAAINLLEKTKKIKNKKIADINTKIFIIAIKCLFFALPAIVILIIPCAFGGFLLRAILTPFKNEVVSLTPKFEKKLSDPNNLHVVSLNVGLAEVDLMNRLNNLSPSNLRASQIADYLLNLNPDILCLQEAFSNHLVYKEIAKKLCQNGYHVVYAAKPQKIGYSSGELIASKLPINNVSFQVYKGLEGVDKKSRKGVLIASQEINGKKFSVANTHFNGGFPGSHEERIQKRKNMMKEAICMINNYKEKLGRNDEQILFVGDFNTSRFVSRITHADVEYDQDAIHETLLEKENCTELTNSKGKYSKEMLKLSKNLKPEHNESGHEQGTGLLEYSLNYEYFLELVTQKAKEKYTDVTKKEIQTVIALDYLGTKQPLPLHASLIRETIESMKENSRKTECLDHMFLLGKSDIFQEDNYTYKIKTPIGKSGILSDHAILEVKLKLQ